MSIITPDFGLIFWMVISFSILLFILKKYAWKPILASLKSREDSISDALESAEKAKDEMAMLKADNEKIMQETKAERELLLKEAGEVKGKIIAEARKSAESEAEKIIKSAKTQIINEKNAAIEDMKKQIVDLSVNIAEKILKKNLEKDSNQADYANMLIEDIDLN